MTWIGGLPSRDYSIEAETAAGDVRNALALLDGAIGGLEARSRAEDVPGELFALRAVRRRLWDAIQQLEAQ